MSSTVRERLKVTGSFPGNLMLHIKAARCPRGMLRDTNIVSSPFQSKRRDSNYFWER